MSFRLSIFQRTLQNFCNRFRQKQILDADPREKQVIYFTGNWERAVNALFFLLDKAKLPTGTEINWLFKQRGKCFLGIFQIHLTLTSKNVKIYESKLLLPLGLIAVAFSADAVIQNKIHGSGLHNEAVKDTVLKYKEKHV